MTLPPAGGSGWAGPAPLLRARGVAKHFPLREGRGAGRRGLAVRAVDGVDLEVWPGETLGLVGESGSGKTTLGRCLLRLVEPTAGTVHFDGVDLLATSGRDLRALRRKMQIIFQDPFSSLDPRMRVGSIVGEALAVHRIGRTRAERRQRVVALLRRVGLDPECGTRYPHEFSGGQRQRIGIARALALDPSFIVADEPVSALDISVRAQVVNLLLELQEERGLAYLFIAHDLHLVERLAHRIAVMYLGKVVELAPAAELAGEPLHPYTMALRAAIPVPDPDHPAPPRPLEGEPPSPVHPPPGCSFHPRCPLAIDLCHRVSPELREVRPGRLAACHLAK